MGIRWAAAILAAATLAAAGALPAQASTDPNAAVTYASGSSASTPVADTSAPPSNAGAAYCATTVYWRAAYSAAGNTVAKIWNHSRWCYYYGGSIYFRTGYTDVYTAPAWGVSNITHTVGWWTPYTSATSTSKADFYLDVGGYHVQSWDPTVCTRLGNHGGSAWC